MSIHHLNFIVETGDFEGFQGSVTESQEDKELEFHEDIWPFARNLTLTLTLRGEVFCDYSMVVTCCNI